MRIFGALIEREYLAGITMVQKLLRDLVYEPSLNPLQETLRHPHADPFRMINDDRSEANQRGIGGSPLEGAC